MDARRKALNPELSSRAHMAWGLNDLKSSLNRLPASYTQIRQTTLERAEARRRRNPRTNFGSLVNHVVKQVLIANGVPLDEPSVTVNVFHPDFSLGNGRCFIECKKWADGNSLRSAVFQGLVVKKVCPRSSYFILVASGIDEDVRPYSDLLEELKLNAVDAWYSFETIDDLVSAVRAKLA